MIKSIKTRTSLYEKKERQRQRKGKTIDKGKTIEKYNKVYEQKNHAQAKPEWPTLYEPISKYMYIYEYLSVFSNSQRMQIKTVIRHHCTHMKQKFKYMC